MRQDAPKIVVVGSSNMDLVVKSGQIPAVGETILGGDFMMIPGGKGANQAVAAAKLEACVHFVTRLGDDIFGSQLLTNLETEAVDSTAAGNGLWQRHDVLASFAGLASRWCLAEDMAGLGGRVGLGRCDRLVGFSHGQLFGAGAFWGAKTGPNPTDQSKNGSKRHLIGCSIKDGCVYGTKNVMTFIKRS